MNIDAKEIFSEKLNFIFLSLPKFKKTTEELQSHLDYWFYAMIHSQPNRNLNEQVLRKDKLFAKLLDVIELNKLTKTEMKKYQQSKLTYEDLRPYAEGHYELGIADGMQQGAEQERSQTALNALKRGFSLQDISAITSLSVAEIKKLRGQL